MSKREFDFGGEDRIPSRFFLPIPILLLEMLVSHRLKPCRLDIGATEVTNSYNYNCYNYYYPAGAKIMLVSELIKKMR